MTTTQVRPSSGGGWNTVNYAGSTKSGQATKSQTYGVTLKVAQQIQAYLAINEWANGNGTGTAATRAQKTAAALGIQLQEV